MHTVSGFLHLRSEIEIEVEAGDWRIWKDADIPTIDRSNDLPPRRDQSKEGEY